jgi:hypothetical protein
VAPGIEPWRKGRIDMGGSVDISGFGKLSMASDANAPLLVVFGGITVGGVQSGVYMWNYMNDLKERFHIFVALSNSVDGNKSYEALTSTLAAQSLNPSQQILYLFSGGYRPGMGLLNAKSSDLFSSIFLVDIWMGVTEQSHSIVPDFYKALANKIPAKLTYVYTSFGANNNDARDYIANKLAPRSTLVKGNKGEEGMQTHMRTNTVAVGQLP